jgi:hypothetical protein
MFPEVNTRVPSAVEGQVASIYRKLFPKGERAFVSRAFTWVESCFTGQFQDYQPIDAQYHDFEHTLQGTLCLARLLQGRHAAGAHPLIDETRFQQALLAILFHDTGYLKKRDDTAGTGAKYTAIHVGRSASFAKEFLASQGYPDKDIGSIQNMINCTGVNANLQAIPFSNDVEQTLGFALGTSDLLGQMAAEDYIQKLPILYLEIAEATEFDAAKPLRFVFKSAEELIRHTPIFWKDYVLPKITNEFGKIYLFLNDPYPDGPNQYLNQVERHMALLQKQLGLPPG